MPVIAKSGTTYELPDGYNAPPVIVYDPSFHAWHIVVELRDAFATSEQEGHDMAVYAIRREFDPNDSTQVWSAVSLMMKKMGARLGGVEIDLDSLVPFKPDEYEAYVAAGNPRSEVITSSIKARTVSEDQYIQQYIDRYYFRSEFSSYEGLSSNEVQYYREHPEEIPFFVGTYVPKNAAINEALRKMMNDISCRRHEAVEDLKPKPSKMEKFVEDFSPKALARSWRDDFIDSPILTIILTLVLLYSVLTMFAKCSG